ncbi:MAG: PCRF domain-containing protein, partial [Clostridia bacterium]
MFEKVEQLKTKMQGIEKQLADQNIMSDLDQYRKLTKEHSTLAPIVEEYDVMKAAEKELADSLIEIKACDDDELSDMLNEEIKSCKDRIEESAQKLKLLLLPKDPNDDKNVIIEVRAGAGGEEAALFGARLVRMYQMYADNCGWKIEMIEDSRTELGGVKEVVFNVIGVGAYSRLKFESGVHRVQR